MYSSNLHPHRWQTILLFALGFWLSASVLLDFVVMPSLYAAGMMKTTGFASAGYSLFWLFNRVELVCAGLALTGLLVTCKNNPNRDRGRNTVIILSVSLMAIALTQAFVLTPQMSAMGAQLNLLEPTTSTTSGMNQMHMAYFGLEMLKLVAGGTVMYWCYRHFPPMTASN
jgi:energy-coupling factor transporter transmembrane protein EcfT